MDNPRVVGHVVAVQGLRAKVELLPETRSALRATVDGVQVAIAINAYLTFSIGAGRLVIGVITDLEARETFDPTDAGNLTLELAKPRRIAAVQLLGTVGGGLFHAGITILPTLDTSAEMAAPDVLRVIFESPPKRNRPENHDGNGYDCSLRFGALTGRTSASLDASYNDLLSRPLAIVGNTGSGKSFSVASIVQKAMSKLTENGAEPHVFVLDINGEYGRAFAKGEQGAGDRRPNSIYLNGREFGIPVWFFNAEEVCAWLSAAEQTQEPVLKDWWAIAKGDTASQGGAANRLRNALSSIDHLLAEISTLKRKSACSHCEAICGHLDGTGVDVEEFRTQFEEHRRVDQYNTEVMGNQAAVAAQAEALKHRVTERIGAVDTAVEHRVRTADSPLFISRRALVDPALINRAVSKEDTFRLETHLTTLRLRLNTRLDDRRWEAFLNYEDLDTSIVSLGAWLEQFGLGKRNGPLVSVLDLSMLSNEVLPYACGVVGRILLDARESLPAARRYKHPWVLVLEEAHNYARPRRAEEERGQRLARLAFERIAKEGRKFGFSLIVASQRPSEISPTIVSQCANFVCHRLQNPDDIDHFRRIIPTQARRLLDQVTILASGEAIAFGSAFHVPTRVQVDAPSPAPYSQTAAPYHEWTQEREAFPV